jgi:hypothetical protein
VDRQTENEFTKQNFLTQAKYADSLIFTNVVNCFVTLPQTFEIVFFIPLGSHLIIKPCKR